MIYFIIGLVFGISGVLVIQYLLRGKPVVNTKARAKVKKATENFKETLNEKISDNISSELDQLGGTNKRIPHRATRHRKRPL